MLAKKVLAAAYTSSYEIGAIVLQKIGGIDLTGRGLNKTAVKVGAEMVRERETKTRAYFSQPLPRQRTQPKTPISLACVSIDGGRMQTRTEGTGLGVQNPHWRETKNALFSRMKSDVSTSDPYPELPACYADRKRMKSLLAGVEEEAVKTSAAIVGEKSRRTAKSFSVNITWDRDVEVCLRGALF